VRLIRLTPRESAGSGYWRARFESLSFLQLSLQSCRTMPESVRPRCRQRLLSKFERLGIIPLTVLIVLRQLLKRLRLKRIPGGREFLVTSPRSLFPAQFALKLRNIPDSPEQQIVPHPACQRLAHPSDRFFEPLRFTHPARHTNHLRAVRQARLRWISE